MQFKFQSNLVITYNEVEGFHRWPSAPAPVSFLRDRHRHTFVIRCAFAVSGLDREVEIFLKQWEIERWLNEKFGAPCEFEALSCEQIARLLIARFKCQWAQVLEDGKGGALIIDGGVTIQAPEAGQA